MFTKVTHITLFVNNQDEALDFYSKKLGFKVHTDAMFGSDMRWLTLNLPEQPDFEVAIMLASSEAEKALVGKQGAGKPFLTLETSNCYKDYQTLSEKGVKFLEKPSEQPWGISACFTDLYGNYIYMCQPRQQD